MRIISQPMSLEMMMRGSRHGEEVKDDETYSSSAAMGLTTSSTTAGLSFYSRKQLEDPAW